MEGKTKRKKPVKHTVYTKDKRYKVKSFERGSGTKGSRSRAKMPVIRKKKANTVKITVSTETLDRIFEHFDSEIPAHIGEYRGLEESSDKLRKIYVDAKVKDGKVQITVDKKILNRIFEYFGSEIPAYTDEYEGLDKATDKLGKIYVSARYDSSGPWAEPTFLIRDGKKTYRVQGEDEVDAKQIFMEKYHEKEYYNYLDTDGRPTVRGAWNAINKNMTIKLVKG